MCKEMPVVPVDRGLDKKRIIGKNGGPRRRRGTWGRQLKEVILLTLAGAAFLGNGNQPADNNL
jgi:hypothetical protein